MISRAIVLASMFLAPLAAFAQQPIRDARYCELLVVTRHGFSGTAAVYTTLGLNDCPDAQWQALDIAKLRKERNAFTIVPNGPRHFVMDHNALLNSDNSLEPETLGGLQFRPVSQMEVKPGMQQKAYQEIAVDREIHSTFDAGKQVYELVSPAGQAYIMQSYSQEVDSTLTIQTLENLADRLKLPKGWQYRVRTLTGELRIQSQGTTAHVVSDELKNTYQRV